MSRWRSIARPDAAIRVMIVEPRTLLGIGVREVFDRASDIEVVAQVQSPTEALQALPEAEPDVILLDVLRSDPSVAFTARRLGREVPGAALVVLGGDDDEASILAAVTIGAVAYVAEIAGPEDLLRMIRRVANGARPLEDEVSARPELVGPILDGIRDTILAEPPSNELTNGQLEILRLVAEGRHNRNIATRLGISEQTVKNTLTVIFHRLGVPNRTRAVTYAARQGWLDDPEASDRRVP